MSRHRRRLPLEEPDAVLRRNAFLRVLVKDGLPLEIRSRRLEGRALRINSRLWLHKRHPVEEGQWVHVDHAKDWADVPLVYLRICCAVCGRLTWVSTRPIGSWMAHEEMKGAEELEEKGCSHLRQLTRFWYPLEFWERVEAEILSRA